MEEFKPFHFTFKYDHQEYECDLVPAPSPVKNGIPTEHELFISKKSLGIISHVAGKWRCDNLGNQRLTDSIGDTIEKHYKSSSDLHST